VTQKATDEIYIGKTTEIVAGDERRRPHHVLGLPPASTSDLFESVLVGYTGLKSSSGTSK
jgi:hypothetical protein